MNAFDRRLFVVVTIVAASLLVYVYYSAYKQQHRVPEPKLVSIDPQLLIGPHPNYKGDPNAPLTLVEFADYQCPACENTWQHVVDEIALYPHGLKLLFRNYPLKMHPQSFSAATVAEAARQQGHFWPMHDALMSSKGKLTEKDIQIYLERLNLDAKQFRLDCQASAKAAVNEDIVLGQRLGVHSTPTFFVCGSSGKVFRLGALSQVEAMVGKER